MNKSVKHTLVGILIGFLVIMLQMTILFGMFFICCRLTKVYEYGSFKYIIVGENGGIPGIFDKPVIAICNFSSSGRDQEVIDIPREIRGKPVRYIGYKRTDSLTSGCYQLYSEKLKKLYIHENIKCVYNCALPFWGLEIMLCSAKDPNLIFSEGSTSGAIKYVYRSVNESKNIGFVANIEFLNNYSTEINEGYYSLDNIKAGETIPQPAKPEREGYEFTGWYTEADCENLWDFAELPEIKEGEEFRLYAGWRRL